MKACDVKYKLTGWTMAYGIEGQVLYITVQADDRDEAEACFVLAGLKVEAADQIHPSVTALKCLHVAEFQRARELCETEPLAQGKQETEE